MLGISSDGKILKMRKLKDNHWDVTQFRKVEKNIEIDEIEERSINGNWKRGKDCWICFQTDVSNNHLISVKIDTSIFHNNVSFQCSYYKKEK